VRGAEKERTEGGNAADEHAADENDADAPPKRSLTP